MVFQSGLSEPTLGVIRKLSVTHSVSADSLVIGGEERVAPTNPCAWLLRPPRSWTPMNKRPFASCWKVSSLDIRACTVGTAHAQETALLEKD
jgi:hypothetical protein